MQSAFWLSLNLLSSLVQPESIEVTVTYRQKIALPSWSELSVFLAQGDRVVSKLHLNLGERQVPIKFRLPYFLSTEAGRVTMYGSLAHDGKVLFSSSDAIAVTGGEKGVELVLSQVGHDHHSMLLDTVWELTYLEEQRIVGGGRVPSLKLNSKDQSISGHGGINQFGGTFAELGSTIQVDPGAMTLMAGSPEQMEVESRYLRVLPLANAYVVKDGALTLLRGKKELARFVPRKG